MTDFKMTDEAVEAASKAIASIIGHGMAEKCESHARAAIEAALPVMFEEAIWQFQGSDGEWYGFHNEKHKRDTEDSLAWPMRQLFVIKEPK